VTIETATATDNCTTVTVSGVRSDGLALDAAYPVGVTTITWTATDEAGNSAQASQTVTVIDAQAPVITAPANVTANNDQDVCAATVNAGSAAATDNCSTAAVSGVRSDGRALNAAYPVGVTTITWKATDVSGNTSEAVQLITVEDKQAPVIQINPVAKHIWPPNNKYVTIGINEIIQSIIDQCGGKLSNDSAEIVAVSSNETDKRAQYIIAPDRKSVDVLASRNGSGSGRIYVISIQVPDANGNMATSTYHVNVSHHSGNQIMNSPEFLSFDQPVFDVVQTLKVYPNPSAGRFSLEFFSKVEGIANLRLLGLGGVTYHQSRVTLNRGSNIIPVNVGHLTTGVYTAALEVSGKLFIVKILIEN
jgi:hypothetical protein